MFIIHLVLAKGEIFQILLGHLICLNGIISLKKIIEVFENVIDISLH